MSVVFVKMERKIFEFSFKVGLLLSLVRRGEGRREGEVCESLRFLWGPHLAPLFLRKCVPALMWAWWTLGSGSGGFLVLFPLNGFLCGSRPLSLASTTRAEKKREDSWAKPPLDGAPRPLTSGFVQLGPKQEAVAGVPVIMGAREDRRGFGLAWTGTGIIWGFLEGGGGKKTDSREKRKRTLREVWHSAENQRRVNGEHQRGKTVEDMLAF